MFTCDKCQTKRVFDHSDYYGYDHYICPSCGDDLLFPEDGYDYYYDDDDDDDDDDDYENVHDDGDYPEVIREREVSLANGERWKVLLWESSESKHRWFTREPVIYTCWDGQLPF